MSQPRHLHRRRRSLRSCSHLSMAHRCSFTAHGYSLPLTFACMMEVIGYTSFVLYRHAMILTTSSILSSPTFFITVAPVFISASIYVCLTKLISWAEYGGVPLPSRIPGRKFILWTFITADAVCTVGANCWSTVHWQQRV